MGKIVRTLSKDGLVMCCAVDSTDAVARMEQIHKTSAVVTAAEGRLLTAASIMGTMLKSTKDSVTLRMEGDGPVGMLIAVSDGTGNVKGYVGNPIVEIPLNKQGKLDVSGAVGSEGFLYVIKDMGMKEPYIGQVPIISGEVAEDITNYYATSEQVPTVCGLGVLVNPDLTVSAAGGYLLQLLPGATDAEITQLEQNIAAMPSVTEMLHAGKTPEDMMNLAMAGFNPSVLDEREVRYQCDCSRERTEQMLLSLGRKELEKLRDEDPHCEVVCHFCHTKYEFDLNKLVKKAVEKAAPASENAEN